MEWIYGYVKTIAVFMLVVTMILNLYPKEEFEKYIRLFAGLLLMVLMMRPVLQWKEHKNSLEEYLGKISEENEVDFEEKQKELEQIFYERMDREGKKERTDFFDEK